MQETYRKCNFQAFFHLFEYRVFTQVKTGEYSLLFHRLLTLLTGKAMCDFTDHKISWDNTRQEVICLCMWLFK